MDPLALIAAVLFAVGGLMSLFEPTSRFAIATIAAGLFFVALVIG